MTAGGIKVAPLRRRLPILDAILGRDRDGFATPWTTAMLFLLPALLVHFALMLYPAALTFWNSVHIIRPNAEDVFVGLANYRELWTDNMFWQSVTNTLLWTGVGPFLDVGLGLLLALALYAGRFPASCGSPGLPRSSSRMSSSASCGCGSSTTTGAR